MVTTALQAGMEPAALSTAAPPRECPIRTCGASYSASRYLAAATRSSTLDEKPVSEKSPSLSPRPVKSNCSTASPWSDISWLMRRTAFRFRLQVKQWAKRA